MSLIYNGVEPDTIIYNSTSLEKVIYNGVVVWESVKKIIDNGTILYDFNLVNTYTMLEGSPASWNDRANADTATKIENNSISAAFENTGVYSSHDDYSKAIYAYFDCKVANANYMHYKFTYKYSHWYMTSSGYVYYTNGTYSKIQVGCRTNINVSTPVSDTSGTYIEVGQGDSSLHTGAQIAWVSSPQDHVDEEIVVEGDLNVSSLTNFYPFIFVGAASYGHGIPLALLTVTLKDIYFY